MKTLLFVIWLFAMCQITVWTFLPQKTEIVSVKPTRLDGSRGYGDNEKYTVVGRERQRESALRALEQNHGRICSDDGRKQLVSGLREYFYHRQNQMKRYPENFGKPGADYIAQQWSTADDKRIDRLVRDAYTNGYLKPDQFDPSERKLIATLINGTSISGKGCAT